MKRFLILITAAVLSFFITAGQCTFAIDDNSKYIFNIETKGKKGSGVILTYDGSFLTTFELIKNADYIKVKAKNGKTYTVDGYRYISPKNNTAILTLKKPNKFTPVNYKKLNEISVNDVIIPTSAFASHIADKKIYNAKNLNWIKFTAQNFNSKTLEELADYAEKNDDMALFYKYLKPYAKKCDIPSRRYALMGTLAMSGYVGSEYSDKELLDNAVKWFALSINSNKNIKASYYGLAFASIIRGNEFDKLITPELIYIRPVKKAYKDIARINKCKDDDLKCKTAVLFDMCRHLQKLTRKGY